MKRLIKNILKKIFSPVVKKLGYTKSAFQTNDINGKNNLLKNFYSVLNHIKFTPVHIVDVGANHGTWTREALKYFPDAYYTLLEPQAAMEQSISDILKANSKVKFNAVGAGSEPGLLKFTLLERDDSCTFLYTEKQAKEMGYQQIDVPVVTLNDFLPTTNLPVPDIIKIDAEGLDINVLEGCSNYFGKTEVFMVEAAVVNKTLPNSLFKIITLMDTYGYRVFEITDLNRPLTIPVLWLVELAFVKKGGLIDSSELPLK